MGIKVVSGSNTFVLRLPIVDLYIAHNRKASNALSTLVKEETKSF